MCNKADSLSTRTGNPASRSRRPSSSRGTFHAPVELVSWSSLAGKDDGSYLRRHGVPDPVSTSVEELVEEVDADVEENIHDVDADKGAIASFVCKKYSE